MAFPAIRFEMEDPVEEHIARLEANTAHIQSDVTDLKTNLQRLESKVDAGLERLDDKLDKGLRHLDEKLDKGLRHLDDKLGSGLLRLDEKLDALDGRMRDSFEALRIGRVQDKVWALLTVGALLGVMARGFKWI